MEQSGCDCFLISTCSSCVKSNSWYFKLRGVVGAHCELAGETVLPFVNADILCHEGLRAHLLMSQIHKEAFTLSSQRWQRRGSCSLFVTATGG